MPPLLPSGYEHLFTEAVLKSKDQALLHPPKADQKAHQI